MRVNRAAYVAVFVIAGLLAGGVFYLGQPRSELVRARMDIPVLTQITGDMLEVVRVSPADVPPDVASSVEEVVGKYAAMPMLAGMYVDRRGLESTPGERALGLGAPLAAGEVAFALPVEPEQAVGGALAPGARVDVVAVPNALRTQVSGVADTESPTATLLGRGYIVLALRTADGQQLVESADGAAESDALIVPRLGSVVIAIPADRVEEFAGAALSSTFYLALAHPAEGTSP